MSNFQTVKVNSYLSDATLKILKPDWMHDEFFDKVRSCLVDAASEIPCRGTYKLYIDSSDGIMTVGIENHRGCLRYLHIRKGNPAYFDHLKMRTQVLLESLQ